MAVPIAIPFMTCCLQLWGCGLLCCSHTALFKVTCLFLRLNTLFQAAPPSIGALASVWRKFHFTATGGGQSPRSLLSTKARGQEQYTTLSGKTGFAERAGKCTAYARSGQNELHAWRWGSFSCWVPGMNSTLYPGKGPIPCSVCVLFCEGTVAITCSNLHSMPHGHRKSSGA